MLNNINEIYEFKNSAKKQEEFNEEMVKDTSKYQRAYKLEKSTIKGHPFWNNETDAFKHCLWIGTIIF